MLEDQNAMAKRRKRIPTHEVGSRNVYAELGFPDADEMLVKAQLVNKISEIIEERGYSQTEAAKLLGLPQPKLSKLTRGQFRGISERAPGALLQLTQMPPCPGATPDPARDRIA